MMRGNSISPDSDREDEIGDGYRNTSWSVRTLTHIEELNVKESLLILKSSEIACAKKIK